MRLSKSRNGLTAGSAGFGKGHVSSMVWRSNGLREDFGGKSEAVDSTSAQWAGKT